MSNKKNAIWNMIGSGTFSVSSFMLLVVVSRLFGIEAAGDFGIAQSTAQLLYIVGLFGANTYQMTDYNEKYKFATYSRLKLCSNGLLLLGAIIVSCIYGDWFRTVLIIGMSMYMCVYSYADLYHCFFFQKNRLDISGKSLFVQSFLSTIVFVLSAWISNNLVFAIGAMIIANSIASYFFSIRVYQKYNEKKEGKSNIYLVKDLLIEVLPLFISLFLMNIMTNVSKYFIDYHESQTIVGVYNTLFIVFAVINLLSGFIFKPSLNRYAELLYKNEVFAYLKKLAKQVLLVVVLTIFAAVAGYLIGTIVLSWVYSADLVSYRLELALICVGGGEIALSSLIYYQLAILRKQTFVMVSYGVGAIVEALLCFLLVPRMGMLGGIVSFIIAYGILGVFLFFKLARCLYEKRGV